MPARPTLPALVLALTSLGALPGCSMMEEGCHDTGVPSALRLVLSGVSGMGEFAADLTWDGATDTCTWGMVGGGGGDTGSSPNVLEPSCTGERYVEIWEKDGNMVITVDGVPDSLDLLIRRDGETLYEQTLSPDYTVSGREECGQSKTAREEILLEL